MDRGVRAAPRLTRHLEPSVTSSDRHPFAVVTGASSGIGLELARVFAQHGYDLLICAEDEGIEEVADALRADGTRVESLQADLASPDGVDQLYDHIQLAGGV